MNKKSHMIKFYGVFITLLLLSFTAQAVLLDRIVAIVEDDVILDRELTVEVSKIVERLQANKLTIPPAFILRKQVLERIIIAKLQRQLAERSGISVSEEMLRNAVNDIAKGNDLTIDEFRNELKSQGINYQSFEESVKNEIIINRLRKNQIGSRITVTDREITHYQETQSQLGKEKISYHLGHILISIPETPNALVVKTARDRANTIHADLINGADFKQTAIAVSDAGDALKGGDLGWRVMGGIPTLFVETVAKMNQGDISELIRSPSGFHIIKLFQKEGGGKHMVIKTKARHILIKTNELINDDEANKRLLSLRKRIIDGDDFAILAKSNSDDKGSAINGGDLDWVGPGDLVPAFEEAMKKLAINEVGTPVQTQFGWHIIQVLERKDKDNSIEHNKNMIKSEIRKRKIEEETDLWLRRLRSAAFVDIKLDRL